MRKKTLVKPYGTLERLYQLKIVLCLGFPLVGTVQLSWYLGLSTSLTFFLWVLISLAVECMVLGLKDIRINKFVPDKKRKISQHRVKEHFLTMRRTKFVFLGISSLGMVLTLPFHYIYLPLAIGWTIYAYAVKEKEIASVVFEPRPLSKEEWEEFDEMNNSLNNPVGSRGSLGTGLSA